MLNAVRFAEQCAPGKKVTVITNDGKRYELPSTPPPVIEKPIDPIVTLTKQLLERDEQSKADIRRVADLALRSEETLRSVQLVIEHVVDGQDKVIDGIKEIVNVVGMPSKPVYDKNGKIIGAQKVDSL